MFRRSVWFSRRGFLLKKTDHEALIATNQSVHYTRFNLLHQSSITFKNLPINTTPYSRRYCMAHAKEQFSATMSTASERVLLPLYIKPTVYKLELEPDLNTFAFKGRVEISFEIQKPSKTIVLNAKDLKIHSAAIKTNGSDKSIKATNISYEDENDYVFFEMEEEINQNGIMTIEYDGELNDKMVGFYRSRYELNGEKKFMASTQMEPCDARRVLPCFDEPGRKAIYEPSLIVPEYLTALANSEVKSETKLENGKKKLVFGRTPIMSSYLLAFVVGELDYIEGHTANGLKVRVYTLKGKTEQGKYSLDVAVKCVPLFEKFFGVNYPMEKLDLVAIPEFSAGAMENFGLVTFRETALLVDPQNSSLSTKLWVAIVVAHEISHHWFGNYVTMQWWSSLWLNEGFATWAEYWAVNQLFPEYKVLEQFVSSDFAQAQTLDALESSHPIDVPIRKASEVDEIFDAISYSKGSCVIRMLAEYLGEENFRNGLAYYMKKFSYSNAETEDLWDSLTHVSGKDVRSLMDSWVKQTGYPVLTITEKSNSQGKVVLELRQHRYLETGHKEEDQTLWKIPISYITSKSKKPVYTLMEGKTMTLEVEGDFEWIKFNAEQTSFFRVRYPDSYYAKLVSAIEKQELTAIDRLSVQEDVVALAKSGYLSSDLALQILSAYKKENSYTVWSSVASNVALFDQLLINEPYYPKFEQFARNLFQDIGQQLGWEPKSNEESTTSLLRTLVLNKLAKYDDPNTIATAKKLFEQRDKTPILADLRGVVYYTVVKNGGQTEYNQVFEMMQKTELNEEKLRCMRAFGATKDLNLLKKTFEMSMDETIIKAQDSFAVINTAANNPKGIQMAWDFFQQNFDTIKNKYVGGFLIGRIVKICTGNFVTNEKANEIEAYFKQHELPSAVRAVSQSVETIRSYAKWLTRDGKTIAQYFNK